MVLTPKISKKMHRKWFNSRISDTENCKFYIVETEWGLPIGQVRLDKKDEKWYINFSLAEFARGKKMGSILLQKIFNNFDPFQKTEFIAEVKQGNIPSCRVFEKIGFVRILTDKNKIVFYKLKKNFFSCWWWIWTSTSNFIGKIT